MGHVAAHRWADIELGRVSSQEGAALVEHAARCRRCAGARERVRRARLVFAQLAQLESPALHWDHLGARIYWVTSSQRRAENRPKRLVRRCGGGVVGAVVCAAVVAFLWHKDRAAPSAAALRAEQSELRDHGAARLAPAAEKKATPDPLRGIVVAAQGTVRVDGKPLDLDRPIRAGHLVWTRRGRVAVQFERDSGFELGDDSSLLLRSFDRRRIELVVEGTLSVTMTARPSEQYVAVVAGRRRVLVRGTAFRVKHRREALEVACARGQVVVVWGAGQLEVRAGERLALRATAAVGALAAQSMESGHLDELREDLRIPLLPLWGDPAAIYASTRVAPDARVWADPAVLDSEGEPAFFLARVRALAEHRAPPVAAARATATRRRASGRSQALAERGRDLDRALAGGAAARHCVAVLDKQNLAGGSYVVFTIGVDRSGVLHYLNIAETNMPGRIARCVRDVVDAVALPQGLPASLTYRLAF